jgi:hypothetical protein
MPCTFAVAIHPRKTATIVSRQDRGPPSVYPSMVQHLCDLAERSGRCVPIQRHIPCTHGCSRHVLRCKRCQSFASPSKCLYQKRTPNRAPLSLSISWLAILRKSPKTAADRNSESPGVDSLPSPCSRAISGSDGRSSDGSSKDTGLGSRVCTGWAAGAGRR